MTVAPKAPSVTLVVEAALRTDCLSAVASDLGAVREAVLNFLSHHPTLCLSGSPAVQACLGGHAVSAADAQLAVPPELEALGIAALTVADVDGPAASRGNWAPWEARWEVGRAARARPPARQLHGACWPGARGMPRTRPPHKPASHGQPPAAQSSPQREPRRALPYPPASPHDVRPPPRWLSSPWTRRGRSTTTRGRKARPLSASGRCPRRRAACRTRLAQAAPLQVQLGLGPGPGRPATLF